MLLRHINSYGLCELKGGINKYIQYLKNLITRYPTKMAAQIKHH